MALPSSNNLDYARTYNEFVRQPELGVVDYVNNLAVGEFEPTYEDRRAAEAEQAAEEARQQAQAVALESRVETSAVVPTREYTPEQKVEVIAYAEQILRNLRFARDAELGSRSHYDVAA